MHIHNRQLRESKVKKLIFEVEKNERLNHDTFDLVLKGNASEITAPGQFVNLDVRGVFLRRPISVCQWTEDSLRLVYKVVGKGTSIMAGYKKGDVFDLLIPLGNGFDLTKSGDKPVLIGGGVGAPPLLALAEELLKKGTLPRAVLGFNTAKDIILYKDFCKVLGEDKVTVTTVDGSFGIKGFVTDTDIKGDYIYACGPLPMLKSVALQSDCGAELSFESRMGCGFGACMGCSMMTKNGAKRVCVEGPVFDKQEVIW